MFGFKKSYKISSETVSFILNNLGTLKSHLIMIAPYFLVCSLALHFIVTYEKDYDLVWLKYAMLVPSTYILSCFCLSWHHACLGDIDAKPHNPLQMDKGVFIFHAMFFGIFFLFAVLNRVLGHFVPEPDDITTAVKIGVFVAMMLELGVITRLMFFLPAQSVGVTLSVPDALRASKGGTVPMILSTILMSLCLGLAITIYMVILFSVLGFAFGAITIPQPMVAITAMVLALPIYGAIFVFMALEVTALSKLYQHGMENNH